MLGSDRNGFSPNMYMPRTPSGLSTDPMISVTVRPRLGSSSVPQASSNRLRVASWSTPW